MTRRRIGFCLLALTLVALAAGGVLVHQVWHDALRANGIRQLDWKVADISLTGLEISQLSVLQVLSGRRIRADLQRLSLGWSWSWAGPQPGTLAVEQLELDVQDRSDREAPAVDPPSKLLPDRTPRWLPRQLIVDGFTAVLPCEGGRCPLSGSFSAVRPQSLLPFAAKLELEHEGHRVTLQGRLSGELPAAFDLRAELKIDGERHLRVQSAYRADTEDLAARWTGTADLVKLPRTDWLLDWVRQWQATPLETVPAQPEAGTMSARWQLRTPRDGDFLRQVSGSLGVKGHLPRPWPIPGVAALSGDLELTLTAEQGSWLAETVQADLHLSEPAQWVRQVPEPLRPESLAIEIRPVSPDYPAPEDNRLLPLRVTLASRGASRIDIDGHLTLATAAPWLMKLDETSVAARVPEFEANGWLLHDLRADLTISGHADGEEVRLDFDRNAIVQVAHIGGSDPDSVIELQGLHTDLHRLQATAGYSLEEGAVEKVHVQGPLEGSAQQVRHPLLDPQRWDFRGELEADLDHIALDGRLIAEAGAALSVSLGYTSDGVLVGETRGRFSGESGGRALAKTLAVWPAPMTITQGSLDFATRLQMSDRGEPEAQARLEFDGLSGLYDRTALTGLDGALEINLEEGWFTVEAPHLKLAQANAGIPVGPAFMAGRYEAPLEEPLRGQLEIQKAVAALFGGEVRVEPALWQLSDLPARAVIEVDELELARLLEQYPAEGLSGTGILSGRVPIRIEPSGSIAVEQGRIAAAEPGGVLTFPADRLRAMGQGNPTMDLVAEALGDFHYSVLNSTIDYDQEGTLQLGLHAEGSNPGVGEGQPIVLNINLEENIPALLTSLQLSGRVNEAITEKVEALVRERQGERGNESWDLE